MFPGLCSGPLCTAHRLYSTQMLPFQVVSGDQNLERAPLTKLHAWRKETKALGRLMVAPIVLKGLGVKSRPWVAFLSLLRIVSP